MQNAITWFELPTADLDRATTFYQKVLGSTLRRDTFAGVPHAFFPSDREGVGGALIHDAKRKPAQTGTVVYLSAPNLEKSIESVKGAGGEVLLGKTDIGDPGFIAMIRDTEGNVVGLHSPRA
jgi:predicted enzyme related to lactoylglutathione lyase